MAMTGTRPSHPPVASPDAAPQSVGLHDRAVFSLADSTVRVSAATCPVCGASEARALYGIEGLEARLVVCARCGVGWLHPMPDAAEVASFYPDVYYGSQASKFTPLVERLVRLIGSRHIKFLCAGLPRGARVLDVGCGRGVLLGALAERGFEVHGVEISAAAAGGADRRVQVRIATDLADADYSAGFFNQVVIWHVLEHLPDPARALREVWRVLRPGGRVIVAVPNFASVQARWAGPAWFHLDAPRHLYHFPLSALRRLLEDSGFVCESEHHFSLRQNPFGWVQSAMNRVSWLPRNGLYTLLHRRDTAQPAPFDACTRFWLRLAWLLGSPFALGASVIEAACRTGATVHVVARRR
jgi:2-polyprenyl-3-methyl-5-hydroxy-6-metoxy-1,4-benzoquinol methylase